MICIRAGANSPDGGPTDAQLEWLRHDGVNESAPKAEESAGIVAASAPIARSRTNH